MAPDQRYCLKCGQRRGDPRLPFMDAVVLMNAVRQPAAAGAPVPPPAKKRDGISPNAALIAGIGVLLLALGIGVLIGRSGNHTTTAAQQAPIVIHGGGGEAEESTEEAKGTVGGKSSGKAGKTPKTKKEKAKALQEANAHPAAEEVLKPAGDVKLPPATIKPGEKCEPGAAGCSKSGEFNGNFFGE